MSQSNSSGNPAVTVITAVYWLRGRSGILGGIPGAACPGRDGMSGGIAPMPIWFAMPCACPAICIMFCAWPAICIMFCADMGVGLGPGLPGTAGAGRWGAGRDGTPGGGGALRPVRLPRPGEGGLKSALQQ